MADTNILVVDDNYYFINAAVEFLNAISDVVVVDVAQSGAEALEKFPKCKPDIVLLDYYMDEMNGIETARKIKSISSSTKIIIVTQFDDDQVRKMALEIGVADAFLSKLDFGDEIGTVIQLLSGD